jgi:hypothetical protein
LGSEEHVHVLDGSLRICHDSGGAVTALLGLDLDSRLPALYKRCVLCSPGKGNRIYVLLCGFVSVSSVKLLGFGRFSFLLESFGFLTKKSRDHRFPVKETRHSCSGPSGLCFLFLYCVF